MLPACPAFCTNQIDFLSDLWYLYTNVQNVMKKENRQDQKVHIWAAAGNRSCHADNRGMQPAAGSDAAVAYRGRRSFILSDGAFGCSLWVR